MAEVDGMNVRSNGRKERRGDSHPSVLISRIGPGELTNLTASLKHKAREARNTIQIGITQAPFHASRPRSRSDAALVNSLHCSLHCATAVPQTGFPYGPVEFGLSAIPNYPETDISTNLHQPPWLVSLGLHSCAELPFVWFLTVAISHELPNVGQHAPS